MNVSIERLRVWLLVGAGLLALVIAGFLGYAHFRTHRFLGNLPAKLGVDVQRETNAFTYSQSVEGKTIYTIHAAKAIQRKDGKVTLRDVGIVLYGRKQDRADRIYGSEFEYDQNAGVIRAMGEVHIDLETPMPADTHAKVAFASGNDLKEGAEEEQLIHVKTSGLVFLQKLGVAATDQGLTFEFKGLTGHAVGADYSSDTGLLTLQSTVQVNGIERGQPVVLTANRAELNRQSQLALLTHAKYRVVGGPGGGRTLEAENVTVHLRPDGSVGRMEGDGGVVLTTGDDGGRITSARGEAELNQKSQLQSAMLSGDVRYAADSPLRQVRGEAGDGKAVFDKDGRLTRVVMTDKVHLHERIRVEDGKDDWNERDLTGAMLEMALTPGPGQQVLLQEAKATGDARLTVVSLPTNSAAGGKGPSGAKASASRVTSVMSGDVLTASFAIKGGDSELQTVHGVGHTVLRRVTETGAEETSQGDSLDANFVRVGGSAKTVKGKAGAKAKGSGGVEEIGSAVQQGHVVITDHPVAKAGTVVSDQRAMAQKAVYAHDSDTVTLTGAVQVTDGQSTIWADRVVMEHETGNATADGAVKANYLQQPAAGAPASNQEPTHVLAARAVLKHDAGVTMFYAAAGKLARLWQGASQVEAPVLQFEQKARRMVARGDGQGGAMPVHAVFVSAGTDAEKKQTVVRVASKELTYSDAARRADFTGGVAMMNADGTMRGQQAAVYLVAAGAKAASGTAVQGAFMGGSVDRVVGTGKIEIDQPGRHATGEQVVYTAADGMFVLTGTAGVPPKVTDETHGTVTGAVLRFHTGDNSVVVSNGTDSPGQRVRTETRVKQ